MNVVLPAESDYPAEVFRTDLPPALRVGCARAYFKTNAVARGIFRRRTEVAFELMPPRCERALDAGTGAGFLLPALSGVADEVEGVDLSPVLHFARAMLDKRGVRNVHLANADLLRLPFHAGAFDVIVCLSVIEHIPDPAAAFAEMGRVLRDDGALIVGYPLEHAVYHFFKSLCRAHNRLRRGRRRHAAGEWFHPHVSDYRRIEGSWDNTFRVDARRNVGVVGVPLYRLLRLVKKA